MSNKDLEAKLLELVHQYGPQQVERSLRQIGSSCGESPDSRRPSTLHEGNRLDGKKRGKTKPNALEYVGRMELSSEKRTVLAELASKFESKAFLPTAGEIRNFCSNYRIEEPAAMSRQGAIPRVFRFIASMEVEDIRKMLDEGMYSGPSKLGPIAAAIRQRGRGALGRAEKA